MEEWIIISLFVIGLCLVAIETVIPGMITGIIGFALIIYSVIEAYYLGGYLYSIGLIIFAIIILPFAIRKARKLVQLKKVSDSSMNNSILSLIGQSGKTISSLYPVGKAVIQGKRYVVYTDEHQIEENQDIIVTKIDGQKIFVNTKSG